MLTLDSHLGKDISLLLDDNRYYFVTLDTDLDIIEGVLHPMTYLVDREEINSPPQLQTPLFCFLSSSLDPKVQSNVWMKLTELPSPFAHDEALLLCQHSATEWVVWIPDYGEAIIEIA